jgi:hypothetical protein
LACNTNVSKAGEIALKMEKSSVPWLKAPIEGEKTSQAFGWM